MRELFVWMLALIMVAVVITAIGVAEGFVGLAWLPFQMRAQTAITRASNGYVTAQQEQLRDLRTAYAAASPAQRAAIRLQMAEIADKIPGQVQPDIAAFLGGLP